MNMWELDGHYPRVGDRAAFKNRFTETLPGETCAVNDLAA
jgi:hypothetical protein